MSFTPPDFGHQLDAEEPGELSPSAQSAFLRPCESFTNFVQNVPYPGDETSENEVKIRGEGPTPKQVETIELNESS